MSTNRELQLPVLCEKRCVWETSKMLICEALKYEN